jgi:spermidine/putrescine transport system ATP-binding protein
MPWNQEVIVFEQNDDGTPPLEKGDEVIISWEPSFTFALDGRADANAGSKVENFD